MAKSYAGPFSDFKGVVLSDEMTSSPTTRRNTPTSKSLEQAKVFLDPSNSLIWPELSANILGKKEKTLEVPQSITEPVLGGSSNPEMVKKKELFN